MVAFITNPYTGRQIQVNGPTYNRLIEESDIDEELIQISDNPTFSIRQQYYNIETSRMVYDGSRTFQLLMLRGYHEVYDLDGNAYIIPPDLLTEANLEIAQNSHPDMSLRNLRNHQQRVTIAELAVMNDIDISLNRERMIDRLAKLNIALCKDCQMPYNPNELKNGLCKEC